MASSTIFVKSHGMAVATLTTRPREDGIASLMKALEVLENNKRMTPDLYITALLAIRDERGAYPYSFDVVAGSCIAPGRPGRRDIVCVVDFPSFCTFVYHPDMGQPTVSIEGNTEGFKDICVIGAIEDVRNAFGESVAIRRTIMPFQKESCHGQL